MGNKWRISWVFPIAMGAGVAVWMAWGLGWGPHPWIGAVTVALVFAFGVALFSWRDR